MSGEIAPRRGPLVDLVPYASSFFKPPAKINNCDVFHFGTGQGEHLTPVIAGRRIVALDHRPPVPKRQASPAILLGEAERLGGDSLAVSLGQRQVRSRGFQGRILHGADNGTVKNLG